VELEHTFTIPVDPATAWTVLRDIERVAPCMPGATITRVDGEEFEGRVKVKVGPIQVTYTGEASYTAVDEAARTATISARGKETRGSGTANATVHARLREVDDGTEVVVTTDLAITGKPAQFGRGVMADIGAKLIGRFADCLAEKLQDADDAQETGADMDGPGPAAAPAARDAGAAPPRETPAPSGRPGGAPVTPGPWHSEDDAIDILDVAGTPIAKRVAPVLAAMLLAFVVVRRLHHRH
jgi:carbon monoxide dehydrogenase subunit G